MRPRPVPRAASGLSAGDLRILHLDAELVAVDKPPGVFSAAARGRDVSAAELLRKRPELRPDDALRLVNRLDRDASGVLIYARTPRAHERLRRQFAERRLLGATGSLSAAARCAEVVYLALVTGYVEDDGQVALPLVYDKRHSRVLTASGRGKPALTRYRVAQRVAGHTLLECQPVTGCLHQIRAHLAAIGHPLTVDPLYGGGQAVLLSNYKPGYRASGRRPERPLIDRLTLHAARVSFRHPATKDRLTLEAPLPKDFRAVLTQLGRLL